MDRVPRPSINNHAEREPDRPTAARGRAIHQDAAQSAPPPCVNPLQLGGDNGRGVEVGVS